MRLSNFLILPMPEVRYLNHDISKSGDSIFFKSKIFSNFLKIRKKKFSLKKEMSKSCFKTTEKACKSVIWIMLTLPLKF